MKLALIQHYAERFKQDLALGILDDRLFQYQILENFKHHWNIESKDLSGMYSQCLQSDTSARLWGGSKNSAKEEMLKMIDVDQEFVRIMFRDLFDESKELLLRLARFTMYCKDLDQKVEKAFGKRIDHYHDLKMLSFYLSFTSPQKYCYYEFSKFKKFTQSIDIQVVPEKFEILRFFKITKSIFGILVKDEALLEIRNDWLKGITNPVDSGLLLCYDFYTYVAELK